MQKVTIVLLVLEKDESMFMKYLCMLLRMRMCTMLLLVLLSSLCTFSLIAQNYATGLGKGSLQREIFWLTWNNGLSSKPADATATNITAGKYEWQFSPTVKIVATVSNLVTLANNSKLTPYTYGGWYADGMDDLYPGVQGAGLKTSVEGGQIRFNIAIDMQMLINNVWQSTPYPGMVIGDAESLADGEFIKATSNGPIAWQLLDLLDGSFASAPSSNYQLEISNNGKDFRFSLTPGYNDIFVQAVMFAKGATQLTNVEMKGRGSTALAIGFVIPFDNGDAPASFGNGGHYIDSFSFSTPFTMVDGTYPITTVAKATLSPVAQVYMGVNNVDADGNYAGSKAANLDDSIQNNDEDGFNLLNQPTIKVNSNKDLEVVVNASNTKNKDATVYGWIDFNGDGKFSAAEAANPVLLKANSVNNDIPLTFPYTKFGSIVQVGPTYARFRISTSSLIDNTLTPTDERATGVAADGEVEDYQLKDITGVVISGTCFNDKNGLSDDRVNGVAISKLNANQLYVYLCDSNNVVLQKAVVGTNGNYTFDGVNNGKYKVIPDTLPIGIGADITGFATLWKSGWSYIAKNNGSNNIAANGNALVSSNGFVPIQTPLSGLDISKVDFAFNQMPIANNDTITTTIDKAIAIDVLANDLDIDGTLDKKTVLLYNAAADSFVSTLNVANEGVYTVNNTTGLITFTPLPTFLGKATPVQYTVNDNVTLTSNRANIAVLVRPVGVNDVDVTLINTPVTTKVTTNDGTSGLSTDVSIATQPINGTVVVNADNTITYTPKNFFKGVDTYTYLLTTPDGVASVPVKVTVTVTANPRPVGVNDTGYTFVNAPITLNVKTNDSSSANGTIMAIGTNPPNGTVVVNANNSINYTPAAGFAGKDVFTYLLTTVDGIVSAPISVTVFVQPRGVKDIDSGFVNNSVLLPVKSNDTASGINTSIGLFSAPANGVVKFNTDGTVLYTPKTNFLGKDTFQYVINTPDGLVSPPVQAIVIIKPIGVKDMDSTTVNVPITMAIEQNDGASAVNAQPVLLTPSSNGTVSILPNGTALYTPKTNFIGKDSYVYQLQAADGTMSSPIIVEVLVKPIALPDADSTIVNTPITTPVKNNDGPSAINGTVSVVSPPLKGTVIVNPDGTIQYTPTPDFVGKDAYFYTLISPDGVAATPVKVNIAVMPMGNPDIDTIVINQPITKNVVVNDGKSAATCSIVLVTLPQNGNATVTAGNQIVFTPATDSLRKETFQYVLVTPDSVRSAPISVQIWIKPIGTNDLDSTIINTSIATKITGNDGASGLLCTLSVLSNPTYGQVQKNNDLVTYVPNVNFLGKDLYTYQLISAYGLVSAPITVNVFVKPIGVNDADTTLVNTPINQKVISNDGASGSSNSTRIVLNTLPLNGTVQINTDKTITYTPKQNFTGNDEYYYQLVTNDGVVSNSIKVTVHIKAFVIKLADLDIQKEVISSNVATVGKDITFKITVTNKGKDSATGVVVTDVLSTLLDAPKNISTTIGSAFFDTNTKLLQWNVGKLAVDEVVTLVFSTRIVAGGTIINTASVFGNEQDPVFANNTATIDPVDTESDIFIPNVITPNGDGKNDYFVVLGLNKYPYSDLSIFNRWDNLVYHSADYANNWDGKGLAAGTYYYVLKIKTLTGVQVKKGWISLIR